MIKMDLSSKLSPFISWNFTIKILIKIDKEYMYFCLINIAQTLSQNSLTRDLILLFKNHF